MNQTKTNNLPKPSVNLLLTVSALAVVGATSFYAGTKFQQSRSFSGGFGSGNFAGRMMDSAGNRQFDIKRTGGSTQGFQVGGMLGSGRPASGEIIAVDGQSLTIKSQDGSTKIVLLSDKTTVNKTEAGATSDLKTGESIMVVGTPNQDGSLTAQVINLGERLTKVVPQTTNQ
ncbi:hypothetical protein KJZ63_02150 [Patescibacteria group bacterium]|nr:hypothetical protein [Patescibacteria group bacterium]